MDSRHWRYLPYDSGSTESSQCYRIQGIDQIQVGNGQGLHIANQGNAFFPSLHSPLHLKNVLHVPSLTKPLLFVKRLTTDNSCFFEF